MYMYILGYRLRASITTSIIRSPRRLSGSRLHELIRLHEESFRATTSQKKTRINQSSRQTFSIRDQSIGGTHLVVGRQSRVQ